LQERFKSGFFGIPWRWLRRTAQIACLAVFFWLFRHTESTGSNDLNAAASIVFRIDPLVAASAMLAGKQIVAMLWPALVTVAFTLILGRFFCGWICPLGSLLDAAHYLADPAGRSVSSRLEPSVRPFWRRLKYFLLAVMLVSAVFGLQLIGFLNPFSILMRALTVAVDPFLSWSLTAPFTWLLQHAGESVTGISEPVYQWLKEHILAFNQGSFINWGISLTILTTVFALEFVERRFWCRNLCPTGALLAWLARFALLRRLPARSCYKCRQTANCTANCRMGAFDLNPCPDSDRHSANDEDSGDSHETGSTFEDEAKLVSESCNLCLDCLDACSINLARFRFRLPRHSRLNFKPSRRLFLASAATGIALPVLARNTGGNGATAADLIRPPGARAENEFLDLCVRCSECLKVCTTNALQPVLFESGLSGMFSPRLMPRMGYCEYNCTLCSQVCPTGAIKQMPLAAKQKFVMGLAVFDKKTCLPYAKGESCITCEEHCPLPEKAIRFREVEVVNKSGEPVLVKQPFTVFSLCIGCGICVSKCPLDGAAGVQIMRSETVSNAVRQEYEKLNLSAASEFRQAN
jgi:polyferredoxin/formate hydrogenlyase subunit 6/NADH:ubiquinone oxidoreductase subunit I